MRVWLVAVALLGIFTAAHADAINAMVAGSTSCGTFEKKYKANPKFTEEFYFTWADGFLTGLNAGVSPGRRRDLAAMNILEQMQYVRNYCDAKPLDNYTDAVRKLWLELPLLAPPRFSPASRDNKDFR
jgi:hypothetical protein